RGGPTGGTARPVDCLLARPDGPALRRGGRQGPQSFAAASRNDGEAGGRAHSRYNPRRIGCAEHDEVPAARQQPRPRADGNGPGAPGSPRQPGVAGSGGPVAGSARFGTTGPNGGRSDNSSPGRGKKKAPDGVR